MFRNPYIRRITRAADVAVSAENPSCPYVRKQYHLCANGDEQLTHTHTHTHTHIYIYIYTYIYIKWGLGWRGA